MVSFPPCKINLGLRVIEKRPDGYHTIETCFYPVPVGDILEIIPSRHLSFAVSGKPIPGKDEDNLCLKAYHLLRKYFNIPPVEIFLHKIIPMGAGLGGGSSDAASTLTMLNEIFALGMSPAQLKNTASLLGSDCSFFTDPSPALGTGRGEVLAPVPISLKGKFLVVVVPPVHVSTAEAYGMVMPGRSKKSISDVLTMPMKQWRENLINDFEEPIQNKFPEIRALKEALYQYGAGYASMSGSGSAVFGIFESDPGLKEKFREMDYHGVSIG